MKRRTGVILAGLAIILGVLYAAQPAYASQPAAAISGHQVCDAVTGPPVLCLNAWNEGPGIKTYSPNVANNNVVVQGMARCGNGDLSTVNCPITGNPTGQFIYQIEYVGPGSFNGDCIGEQNESGNATLVACNNSNGTGGGLGTLQEAAHFSCPSGFNSGVNVHFTNLNGGWSHFLGIDFNNSVGAQVILNGSFAICLGYIPFG